VTLRRIKHTSAFDERLALKALQLREQAKAMPKGKDRNVIRRRCRKAEVAVHVSKSLGSPGLVPPK
jgi:hypothetical protein